MDILICIYTIYNITFFRNVLYYLMYNMASILKNSVGLFAKMYKYILENRINK